MKSLLLITAVPLLWSLSLPARMISDNTNRSLRCQMHFGQTMTEGSLYQLQGNEQLQGAEYSEFILHAWETHGAFDRVISTYGHLVQTEQGFYRTAFKLKEDPNLLKLSLPNDYKSEGVRKKFIGKLSVQDPHKKSIYRDVPVTCGLLTFEELRHK